jgi:hypothetical protein
MDPSSAQSHRRHGAIRNSVTLHATLQHDIRGRNVEGARDAARALPAGVGSQQP